MPAITNLGTTELRTPTKFDDLLVVKICMNHGLCAPMLEDDRCHDFCTSTVVFATFAEFWRAIAPKNWIIF